MTKAEKVREIREKEKKENQLYLQRRVREVKCFWTWPFTHYYENYRCVNCGHYRTIGP